MAVFNKQPTTVSLSSAPGAAAAAAAAAPTATTTSFCYRLKCIEVDTQVAGQVAVNVA